MGVGSFIVFVTVISIFGGVAGYFYDKKRKQEKSQSLNAKLLGIQNFSISRRIEGYGGTYIFAVDETKEKVAVITAIKTTVINFSDIIGVEQIEDGNTISKKSIRGIIGGAIIGEVVGGTVGEVIGGLSANTVEKKQVSTLKVKILLRNSDIPMIMITCFDSKTMTVRGNSVTETDGKSESYIYKIGKVHADNIKDLLSIIIDKVDKKSAPVTGSKTTVQTTSSSVADELLKLNELKEKGILTQEEFENQKKKLLS